MKYEHRKTTMFKLLDTFFYCIIHNKFFLDYMFLQIYPKLYSFDQLFEDTYYNSINVIFIPEVLMNIVSCHKFLKENPPTLILTCRRSLLSYHLSKIFVILPQNSKSMNNIPKTFYIVSTKYTFTIMIKL